MKRFIWIFLLVFMVFLVGCDDEVEDKDEISPTVVIYNTTTAKAGDILIEYGVSDNVTAVDKLVVDIVVLKDGVSVEVVNNVFVGSEGVYNVTVTATDEALNVGSASLDITVKGGNINDGTDKEEPTLFIDMPDLVYEGQNVEIVYYASDNVTTEENLDVVVSVKKDGNEISLSDNCFVAGLGEYEISVSVTDEAGNCRSMVKKIQALVDDVCPVIDSIELSGEAIVGEAVNLDLVVSDNVTSLEDLDIDITLFRDGTERKISQNFVINTEGDYLIKVLVKDKALNEVSATLEFEGVKAREDRDLSVDLDLPDNVITEEMFINAPKDYVYQDGDSYVMLSDGYSVYFVKDSLGYSVHFVDNTSNDIMYMMNEPIIVYFRNGGNPTSKYTDIEITNYGILASGVVTSSNGSVIRVEDRYYYPDTSEVSIAVNVQRALIVLESVSEDKGYQSIFAIHTVDNNPNNLEWFIPNRIFSDLKVTAQSSFKVYRETVTGLPMVMVRDASTGYSISLARYQPVINYETNSYACVGAYSGTTSIGDSYSSIEINYPTRDTARRYFDIDNDLQIVYDMSIMATKAASYDIAMVDLYNNQYLLEDVRIVNTDIDVCYDVINEDFKSFFLENNRFGITSYGLPWRVTIENGLIGPKSYQAGFVGQQIPCAYNMMLYGVMNNDQESLSNGMKIINFWVNDIDMMSDAGVPMIWYDGASNRWLGYPTFTRMAVDAMEGLFDAYRLAVAHDIEVNGWIEAVLACAEWLVKAQNSDGSWYRCYNYQGTYYKGNESDITWNPGDITRSTSKNNSTMPVRFLGKMYEFTGDVKYLNAITKAGDFIYEELFTDNAYYGGTCDNPDCMDKEAGVFAMYAYDTLYTLTKDEKWIRCLEQATIFTMSTVITVSYKISAKASDLKAALFLKAGYSDGLSYITCEGNAVDNYAAYIYYQLFRLYVHTGDKVYYKMAEFIQQNTKSSMDWDGMLNYSYKSLTPEASTIYGFGYSSAVDDDGVQGVWLPWQSAANAEPIAKMYDTFGAADVKEFEDVDIEELRAILYNYGVGGKAHRKF